MAPLNIKKTSNILIIVLFFAFIVSSPITFLVQNNKIWSEAENRALAPSPTLPESLKQVPVFFQEIENYVNDHFGFRDFYLRRYHREMDKRFGISGSTSTVIKGLEGWYYFYAFDLVKDFLGKIPLSRQQLQSWFDTQNEKHNWLGERGVHYLYFAAPNKQSVYPEYLMDRALTAKGTSRFEQLLQITNGQLPDYMVNLHTPLQDKKNYKPLYYKTDSHWNKLGAYIAFQEVFKKLALWFPDENFTTHFEFTADITSPAGNYGKGGDLVHMLMQPEIVETFPAVKKFQPCAKYRPIPFPLNDIKKRGETMSFVKQCPTKKLTAVIFQDSFFVHLEPFFSENFNKVIYLWKDFDRQNMEEILVHFKPDIVIEEVVERHIFDSLLEEGKEDN